MRSPNAIEMCETCEHSAARFCGVCAWKDEQDARTDERQKVLQEVWEMWLELSNYKLFSKWLFDTQLEKDGETGE